jgi:hypothetical protein
MLVEQGRQISCPQLPSASCQSVHCARRTSIPRSFLDDAFRSLSMAEWGAPACRLHATVKQPLGSRVRDGRCRGVRDGWKWWRLPVKQVCVHIGAGGTLSARLNSNVLDDPSKYKRHFSVRINQHLKVQERPQELPSSCTLAVKIVNFA